MILVCLLYLTFYVKQEKLRFNMLKVMNGKYCLTYVKE